MAVAVDVVLMLIHLTYVAVAADAVLNAAVANLELS
jgi:hypothetical protein